MIPVETRKTIAADYDEGMTVESISRVVRISTSAIYRLLKKRQKPGKLNHPVKNAADSRKKRRKNNDVDIIRQSRKMEFIWRLKFSYGV